MLLLLPFFHLLDRGLRKGESSFSGLLLIGTRILGNLSKRKTSTITLVFSRLLALLALLERTSMIPIIVFKSVFFVVFLEMVEESVNAYSARFCVFVCTLRSGAPRALAFELSGVSSFDVSQVIEAILLSLVTLFSIFLQDIDIAPGAYHISASFDRRSFWFLWCHAHQLALSPNCRHSRG